MQTKILKLTGLIVVALAALFVIGCSSDNPASPARSALKSGSLENPSDSRFNLPDEKFEFVYTGRVAEIDRSNRTFEFEEKEGLTVYVAQDAKLYALPGYVEIPFDSRTANSAGRLSSTNLDIGATATVYGEQKGEDLVIAQIIEVSSAYEDAIITEEVEVGDPGDDRSYDVVFRDRLNSVDFGTRTLALAERMNLSVYVETDAPIVYMPSKTVYTFDSQRSNDGRSSDEGGVLLQGAQVQLYGFFKSDELFIAERVDVWQLASSDELISNSIVISDPSDIDRNYDFQFEGRLSSIDRAQRSFELGEREGLLFSLDRDARIISIPDGAELKFNSDDERSSAGYDGEINIGSRVNVYGTFKGDELFLVELLEVYNSSIIGEAVIVTENSR